jgi:hypothetical protein
MAAKNPDAAIDEATRSGSRAVWLAALHGAISEYGDRPFSLRRVVQATCDAVGCDSPCADHYPDRPMYRRLGDEIVEVC